MFDFRRKALFCLEKRLSKHKMTLFSKNLGGNGPPGYSYGPRQWNQRGLFQPRDYLSQNPETDCMMRVCFDCHTSVL